MSYSQSHDLSSFADVVYISYDEPNSEENFFDLATKIPFAKRIHGIKGFDFAHRAAANICDKNFVFIIDGDNKVHDDFVNLNVGDLPVNGKNILSWGAQNVINGLIYGNGGVKLWPTDVLQRVKCHDDGSSTDWFYKIPFTLMNDYLSDSICNASPLQAFRTGFREGVKLCLNEYGAPYPQLKKNVHQISKNNLRRLIIWMSVGLDITNGIYAIFGARLAFLKILCESNFDYTKISDYEWFKILWDGELSYVRDGHFREHFQRMAIDIRQITGLPVSDLDINQSKFAKFITYNPPRLGANALINEAISLEELKRGKV